MFLTAVMGLVSAAIFLAMRLKEFGHGFDLSGSMDRFFREGSSTYRRNLTREGCNRQPALQALMRESTPSGCIPGRMLPKLAIKLCTALMLD